MQPISRDFQTQQSVTPRLDIQPGVGISVTGNTISWPSHGWHEVQYAASGNTIREGGQSASLPPGTYNVINHTTGERFENIVVGQDTSRSISSLGTLQSRSMLDVLRDSPSTADRLGGRTNNGTTETNTYANSESSVVSRALFSYGDVECSYDRQPGVTPEGEVVEDYGPCADGPDEAVDRTVSIQYGEDLPRNMGAACAAAGIPAAGAVAVGGGMPAAAVAGGVACGFAVSGVIMADPAVDVTTTTTSGSGTTDSRSGDGTISPDSPTGSYDEAGIDVPSGTRGTNNRRSGGSGTTDSNSGGSGTANSGGGFGDRTSEPGGMGGV